MEQVLKVLVHRVDHPVAEGPQEKEGGDKGEGDTVFFSFGRTENMEKLVHGFGEWGVGGTG
jgi:hypothetical protein